MTLPGVNAGPLQTMRGPDAAWVQGMTGVMLRCARQPGCKIWVSEQSESPSLHKFSFGLCELKKKKNPIFSFKQSYLWYAPNSVTSQSTVCLVVNTQKVLELCFVRVFMCVCDQSSIKVIYLLS